MPQIHLRAEVGDYAPLVLMPGDPGRATMIAGMFDGGLEGSRLVNQHRSLLGPAESERAAIDGGLDGPENANFHETAVIQVLRHDSSQSSGARDAAHPPRRPRRAAGMATTVRPRGLRTV